MLPIPPRPVDSNSGGSWSTRITFNGGFCGLHKIRGSAPASGAMSVRAGALRTISESELQYGSRERECLKLPAADSTTSKVHFKRLCTCSLMPSYSFESRRASLVS
ncbi:hypothetical protein BDZ97DRAFT_1835398 [Flammula alnicola]|nr:hypothetical protein BDZ97DRAFT_1835398 [Flammula alnicola]